MILVTGGLGYLGSHIALYLMSKGHEVVLVDNLSHASMESLERLEYITKLYIPFMRLDVRNTPALQKVFEQYPIDYVIHCAGFKSLSESAHKPLEYYNNNLSCIISVLRAMQRGGVRRLVNLSSLTVYGASGTDWKEQDDFQYQHGTPYIRAQQNIEHILQDTFKVDDYWQILNLRLGNIMGTFTDGKLGEWTQHIPKSLIQHLLQVIANQRDVFEIFNQSLDTEDGTAERSYLHVMDMLDALYKLMLWSNDQKNFLENFNLCHPELHSLNTLIKKVEDVTSGVIQIQEAVDQVHEFAQLKGNMDKLNATISWQAEHNLEKMVQDQWTYYQASLNGV